MIPSNTINRVLSCRAVSRWRRCTHLIVVLNLAAACSAYSGDPVPQAADMDSKAVHRAARISLACATEFLVSEAADHYKGYAVEPITEKKIIRWEQKEVHYRKESYEIRYTEKKSLEPIYEYIYEEKLAVAKGSSDAERRNLKKVKRVVGRRKTGTRQVTRLVVDPKGKIVKAYTREVQDPSGSILRMVNVKPIYGKGAEVWTSGFLGQNGLVLLALLKSGVPQKHEMVSRLAGELNENLANYGLPDTTWDVAWLAAAFVHLKGVQYEDARKQLISKLLDGQITDGRARGLWGPVCINTALLSAMIVYEQSLLKRQATLKEIASLAKGVKRTRKMGEPTGKALTAELARVETALAKIVEFYRGATQQGLRFESVTRNYVIQERFGGNPVTILGLPYNIYSQSNADLESTALALYALREAADKGWLPKETSRPKNLKDRPVILPELTSAILARAVTVLANQQRPDGWSSEINIQQIQLRFEPLGFEPLAMGNVLQLKSPMTLLSNAQACSIYLNAASMVGMKAMQGRFEQPFGDSYRTRRKVAELYLEQKEIETQVGRAMAPYDFIFYLTGIHRRNGGSQEVRRDLWSRFAHHLVLLQGPDGGWSDGTYPFRSSSSWARRDAAARRTHKKQQAKLPKEKRQPFNPKTYWPHHRWHRYNLGNVKSVSTAYAMLFLADGIRRPVAGFITSDKGGRGPKVLRAALDQLQKKEELTTTTMRIGPRNVESSDVAALPVIVLNSSSRLSSARISRSIRNYMAASGTVVVEIRRLDQVAAWERRLLRLVKDGVIAKVPKSAQFMKEYRGNRPALKAVMNSSKRIVAVLLPISSKRGQSNGLLSPAQAGQVTRLLIEHRVERGLFNPTYPYIIKGVSEPFVDRLDGLMILKGLQTLPPEPDEKATVPKGGGTSTDTVAPPPKPEPEPERKLKPDEVW